MDADRAVERLTLSIEDFNSVFIRLAASDRLSFSALSVLHTLSRMGPCRLSDLVRTEQIKQPALTSAVAKLERGGLIGRRHDPSDGRASMLSLTADGQSIVSRRHADRVERLRGLIDRLSPADRGQLLSIAGVLDQIVQLASEQDEQDEQDEKHDERSGK
jgi:DNA-binding MarR family transcriptional regulator